MIVITADQVDSRHHADLARDALAQLSVIGGHHLVRAPDRTAGDEIQLATEDAGTALESLLHLTRDETWSVGLGLGDVREPLPAATREMTGSAFVAAREAVDAAKKRRPRIAVRGAAARFPEARDLEPLLDLLVHLRERRTPEGWEVYDLLRRGLTQRAAAEELGITPQAVSLRVQSAHLRTEFAARDALVRLFDASNRGNAASVPTASTGGTPGSRP